MDPRPGGGTVDPGTSDGCSGGFAAGCPANCIAPLEGGKCVCRVTDCEATQLSCECDASCYPDAMGNVPADCAIQIGPDGKPVITGELGDSLSGCTDAIACTQESDLTPTLMCGVGGCDLAPLVEVMVERAPSEVDVLFVVDNSASMGDDQAAAACAVDSFFNTADARGADYRTGVLSTDLIGDDPTGQSNTVGGTFPCAINGDRLSCTQAPGLVGLENGSCSTPVTCSCPPVNPSLDTDCKFNLGGDWIDSTDPNAEALLRDLIVQGETGSWYESGLEAAFQYFAAQERSGTFDATKAIEIVVISDEDAEASGTIGALLCPFNTVDRNTAGIPDFNPPTPTNSTSLAGCKQDLIDFYAYYFSSRNIIVHGLLFTANCASNNTESVGQIYREVVGATGGISESICACGAFDSFFDKVGARTADLSTSICNDEVPLTDSLEVIYTENGMQTPVPQSETDGFTYDPAIGCIVFHGSWIEKFGSFSVRYRTAP